MSFESGPVEVVLTDTVVATGNYAYLPFDVPPGTTRIDLKRDTDVPAALGLGLFDARGSEYQSPGFRGIAGGERREAFIALDSATPGFLPGPIEPGRWTVIVPVFLAALPTRVTIRVRMTQGPAVPPLLPGPLPGVVRDTPGWYRGDLHCHTIHSSDAWATGTAMTPPEWANRARELGLDFLCMTDHNTIAQNWSLGSDAGAGVLLMAGEEMTNYFHGHAAVVGLDPGEWLDFRQSPLGLPLPTGGRRIQEFIAAARSMGAYVAAAHPLRPGLSWQFIADGVFDPAARTDGFEVWNGPWQVNEEMALRLWDYLLREGWDVVANGGSDLHGVGNTQGYTVGLPTTVVYAPALSRDAIVDTVRAGRSFITRQPDGVEIYLTASGPGEQQTFTGGTIWGEAGDLVSVRVLIRRADGLRLSLRTETGEVLSAELHSDEQTIDTIVPIGQEHGFVRAEIRTGQGRLLPVPQLDMEAFTNPIWLRVGDVPAGTVSEFAPPPPFP
jgi:predicted metal-dependent phosphoesterase TrpH